LASAVELLATTIYNFYCCVCPATSVATGTTSSTKITNSHQHYHHNQHAKTVNTQQDRYSLSTTHQRMHKLYIIY